MKTNNLAHKILCQKHDTIVCLVNLNKKDMIPIKCKLCINNSKNLNNEENIPLEEFIYINKTNLKNLNNYMNYFKDIKDLIDRKENENFNKIKNIINKIKIETLENIENIFNEINDDLDKYVKYKNKFNLDSINDLIKNSQDLLNNTNNIIEIEENKITNLNLNLNNQLINSINNFHRVLENNNIYKELLNKFNNTWDDVICKIDDSSFKLNKFNNSLQNILNENIKKILNNNEFSKLFLKFPFNLNNEIDLIENNKFDFVNKNNFYEFNKIDNIGHIEMGNTKFSSISKISISDQNEISILFNHFNYITIWKINEFYKKKIWNHNNFNLKIDDLKSVKNINIPFNDTFLTIKSFNNFNKLNIFNLFSIINFKDKNIKITSWKFDGDNILLITTNNGYLIKLNYYEKFISDHKFFGLNYIINDIKITHNNKNYLVIINEVKFQIIDKFNFEKIYEIKNEIKYNDYCFINNFNYFSLIDNKNIKVFNFDEKQIKEESIGENDDYFNLNSENSENNLANLFISKNLKKNNLSITNFSNSVNSTNNKNDFILIYNDLSFVIFLNILNNSIIYKFDSLNLEGINSIFIITNKIIINNILDKTLELLKENKLDEINNLYEKEYIKNLKLFILKKKNKMKLVYESNILNSINVIEKNFIQYKNNLQENFLFIYGNNSNKIEIIYLD